MIEYLDKLEATSNAEVWLVRRDGVLAIAHIYFDEDPRCNEQVARDSRIWLGFSHPHISPLLDITERPNLVVITGDERGPNILQMARKLDDLRQRETWALSELCGVAEGIAMMQERQHGLVHRRADAQHMIVGGDGHARMRAPIADRTVGAERGFLGRGTLIKGLGWMSPEQVTGREVTPASDVFQLAATAYALLALERAFGGQTEYEQLLAIREAKPPAPPPTSDDRIAGLLLRNLAKNPADRMQTPAELAAALRQVVGEPSPLLLAKISSLRGDPKPPPNRSAAIVGSRCQMQWSELSPTAADGVRHCASCKADVVNVGSIEALIPLLGKSCIRYEPK